MCCLVVLCVRKVVTYRENNQLEQNSREIASSWQQTCPDVMSEERQATRHEEKQL